MPVNEETDDEEKQIYRGLDYLDPGLGGSWCGSIGYLPAPRDQSDHILQMESQVRRDGCVGSPAAEGAGIREHVAEEAAAGPDAGQRGPQGFVGKAVTTPQERRAAAGHAISQRRACRLVGVDPKIVGRDPEPDNPEIRAAMRAIASERRRFGYRRVGVMLEREGFTMNHKKLRRIYREEGLSVRGRRVVHRGVKTASIAA